MVQAVTTDTRAARATKLRRRLRTATYFLMFGLAFSGATAIPIPTEMALANQLLGPDLTAGGMLPAFMVEWAQQLRDGIQATQEMAPVMF